MENLKLIASSESPYCQSVKGQLWAAGLPHTTETLTWEELRTSARVRALNPKAQVPLLEHAKGVLSDSLVISTHICEWSSLWSPTPQGTDGQEAGSRRGGGLAWLASHDAAVFRTAEVELRDVLMEVYRSPSLVESAACSRMALACALLTSLLEASAFRREAPEATPGVLHAAFLLNALLGLLEKKGCGVPPEASQVAAVLSEVPLVAQVLIFFGQRNHMVHTVGAS